MQTTIDQTLAILQLMSIMILADDKVRDEEIQAFQYAVETLSEANLLNKRVNTNNWFCEHRQEIEQMFLNNKQALKTIAKRLQGLKHAKTIVENLSNIAVADNEFHTKEHDTLLTVRQCLG